ncbi:MAG: hypothetical protein AAF725_21635 [Acidobacteriota bacterium]
MSEESREERAALTEPAAHPAGPEPAASGRSLYRPEALEAYRHGGRRARAGGKLAARRPVAGAGRGVFYGLLCAGLGAFLAAALVPIERLVTAHAEVRAIAAGAGSTTLLLEVPAARRRELALGQRLVVRLEDRPEIVLGARLTVLGSESLDERGRARVEARLESSHPALGSGLEARQSAARGRAAIWIEAPLLVHFIPSLSRLAGGQS